MSNQVMYQVHVIDQFGKDIPIGPVVNVRDVLEPMVEAINLASLTRKERQWRAASIFKIEAVKQ